MAIMILLYILRLRDGYFYVGTTTSSSISLCIRNHYSGNDVEWTRIHKPVALVKQIECSEGLNRCLQEDLYVKQLMLEHGLERVRGGTYSCVELNLEQKVALENEFRYARKYSVNYGSTRPDYDFEGDTDQDKSSAMTPLRVCNINVKTKMNASTSKDMSHLIENFSFAANALIHSQCIQKCIKDCIKATLTVIEIKTGTSFNSEQASKSSPLSTSSRTVTWAADNKCVNTSLDTVATVSTDSSRLLERVSSSESFTCVEILDASDTSIDNDVNLEIVCTRCGRSSHHRSRCFETIDIHGFDLSDCF